MTDIYMLKYLIYTISSLKNHPLEELKGSSSKLNGFYFGTLFKRLSVHHFIFLTLFNRVSDLLFGTL